MSEQNVTVAVFNTPADAAVAIMKLKDAGFDDAKLSLAQRLKPPAGQTAEREYSIFSVPDLGDIYVLGPLETWLIAVLENAAIFGELTAFGAGLYAIGLSRTLALQFEAELRANKYLVIAHGSSDEVARAKGILDCGGPVRPPS